MVNNGIQGTYRELCQEHCCFFDGINGKNELGISFMTWDIPYNYMVIWLHRYIVIIYIYTYIYTRF